MDKRGLCLGLYVTIHFFFDKKKKNRTLLLWHNIMLFNKIQLKPIKNIHKSLLYTKQNLKK